MSELSEARRELTCRLAEGPNEVRAFHDMLSSIQSHFVDAPSCSRLLHAAMWSVDGNFQLGRNHKGGGPASDPSLYQDWALWAKRLEATEYVGYWDGKAEKRGKVSKTS